MQVADGLHLTYCTNIHPAVGWDAVLDSLRAHAPALQARLSPDAPFGIGLRLSGDESRELLANGSLDAFKRWLDAEGLYVFTINGFPHSTFHGPPVKADVHAPDWRSEERVAYTLRLAEILEALLPDSVDGTISTSPLSFKAWTDDLGACTASVRRVDEELRGTRVSLAIEPGGGEEWRVHLHVSIFLERYGKLESTQDHLRAVIELVRDRTLHLEIETYTWDVLPPDLKASSVDSIAREYEWVLDVLR